MDYQIPIFFGSLLFLYFLVKYLLTSPAKLPPGPTPWPVFGNLFHLSSNPHVSLTNLSKTYGPLMTVELGSVTTVVISTADMAREVYQKHDLAFSSRQVVVGAHVLNHYQHSIVWMPVCPKWRNLRKISAIHLFSKRQMDATERFRDTKLRELLDHVTECCRSGRAVEVVEAAFTTSLNLLSSTFFSTDLDAHGSASSHDFKGFVAATKENGGKTNLANFFPILDYFDMTGARGSTEPHMRKAFDTFDGLIEQRLSSDPSSASDKDDFLAKLLKISAEEGSELRLGEIKHLFLDLFLAGTDTTSSTFEWAMTELLRNPDKMAKAQAELDEVLGRDGVFQESDITRLPYLQAVLKETFRLHPSIPMLLPHKSIEDVVLHGYTIPKDSQILINVWAIGRDPNTWPNPSAFIPERFIESEIDFGGQDFELLPFGAGRRMCPAQPLASRMLYLMLANFLYRFNWKLEDGMRGEDIDMGEEFGITVNKAKPLLAIPVARK